MRALNELRNLDIDVIDIDGEVAYLAFAKSVQAEYATFSAEPPEWLPLRIKQLERDIKSKRQAIIEKRIRDLENRKSALLPRDKKIENIDADLAALKKQLEP